MQPETSILVTGGNGMLGRNFMEVLERSGFRNVYAPASAELDLCDGNAVQTAFERYLPEIVFHLAAKVGGIRANMLYPAEFLQDNLLMGANVLRSAHASGVKRVVLMGSSCMYPRECAQPMQESSLLTGVPEPTNEAYAIAKLAIAKLGEYYRTEHGMECLTLVAPNLYGTHERFDAEHSHVVSALLLKFHEAKTKGLSQVTMWGTGSARREFLLAADMAGALLEFAQNESAWKAEPSYVNVGSGEDVSIRELASLIAECSGWSGEILWDATKPDGMPRKLMDSSRAQALGWKSRTSLKEGIVQTYAYYLSTL